MNALIYRGSIGILVKLIVSLLVAACCSGCLDAGQPASAGPVAQILTPTDVDATIKRLDLETYQPELHDDFKKPEGVTPKAEPEHPKEIASKIGCKVYGPKDCRPCDRCVAEGNASKRFHFEKQKEIPKQIAEVADKWNQDGYPIVTFLDRNGTERWVIWRGLTDFEKRYDRSVPPKKAPVRAEAGAVAGGDTTFAPSTANAPAAALFSTGNWWTSQQLRSHLQEHGYSASRIAGMSDAECVAAHQKAHEGDGFFSRVFGGKRRRRAA